jgi:hypothetical protein
LLREGWGTRLGGPFAAQTIGNRLGDFFVRSAASGCAQAFGRVEVICLPT